MIYSELAQAVSRFPTEFPWVKVAKHFDKVESTQIRITQFLPKETDGAVVVLSETQSKGTGRLGRPWASPVGGIWFTLGLPIKDLTVAQVAPFSMVASLSVAQALKEVNNLQAEIKWPNDIRYEKKKVAGILLTTTEKFKNSWLLVGVGINVNNEIPPELAKEATSIKVIRGQSQGRSRLIEAVLANLWAAWQDFHRTGFGPYHKAYEQMLVGKGQATKIMAGKKSIEGTMVGIDPQGGLLLKSGAQTQTVHAGEIVG